MYYRDAENSAELFSNFSKKAYTSEIILIFLTGVVIFISYYGAKFLEKCKKKDKKNLTVSRKEKIFTTCAAVRVGLVFLAIFVLISCF